MWFKCGNTKDECKTTGKDDWSDGAYLGSSEIPNEAFDDNWGTATLAFGRKDQIKFRSSRTINIPSAGVYEIAVGSDDGINLWIDDTLIGSYWKERSFTTDVYDVILDKGDRKFKIDYYENDGDARVSFNYKKITSTLTIDEITLANTCKINIEHIVTDPKGPIDKNVRYQEVSRSAPPPGPYKLKYKIDDKDVDGDFDDLVIEDRWGGSGDDLLVIDSYVQSADKSRELQFGYILRSPNGRFTDTDITSRQIACVSVDPSYSCGQHYPVPSSDKATLSFIRPYATFHERTADATGSQYLLTVGGICGNKVVDCTEQCDPPGTCSGANICSSSCGWVAHCGDKKVNCGETCDPPDSTAACTTATGDAGTKTCSSTCGWGSCIPSCDTNADCGVDRCCRKAGPDAADKTCVGKGTDSVTSYLCDPGTWIICDESKVGTKQEFDNRVFICAKEGVVYKWEEKTISQLPQTNKNEGFVIDIPSIVKTLLGIFGLFFM